MSKSGPKAIVNDPLLSPIHSNQSGYGTDNDSLINNNNNVSNGKLTASKSLANGDNNSLISQNAIKSDDNNIDTSYHNHNNNNSDNNNIKATDFPHDNSSVQSDLESAELHKSVRNASWLSIFFLITTDILGPTSAPYALSQLGYIPGSILFTLMGFFAGYTGWLLWKLYLALDSENTPVRNYSDLALIIFGSKARHTVNILQSLQLLFNVAVIILGNAQGLSQISNNKICFSLLALMWTAVGMLIGQIKQLKNFTHLSNLAIWMNFAVIFITMAIVPNSEPNYASAKSQNNIDKGPISTGLFINVPFTAQVVGVMQIVYSYGGALMFIEFLSEMRNPREFMKAMVSAQTIILVCYMVFGLFVYSFQGQFTINPANQGISTYSWQTATNALNLASALIAAGLYGNVGMKVLYNSIVIDIFNGPSLNGPYGRKIWIVLALVYWSVSFVVASSIPQFSNIAGLVAALCILQFTYTFPPLLMLGYELQRDALLVENSSNPSLLTPGEKRIDSWWKLSRWTRGFLSGSSFWVKFINLFLFIISCVGAGLGIYSSIQQIYTGFQTEGAASSFGCTAPV